MLVDLFKQISNDSYRKATRHKRLPGQTILFSEMRGGSKTFEQNVEIVELDPATRTMFWSNQDGIKAYQLPCPYMVFGCVWYNNKHSGGLWVMFNDKPTQSIHDPLYFPPLTNVNNSCRVCIKIQNCTSAQDLIAKFFQTPFTLDHGPHAHPGWERLDTMGKFPGWSLIKDPLKHSWGSRRFSMAQAMKLDGVIFGKKNR